MTLLLLLACAGDPCARYDHHELVYRECLVRRASSEADFPPERCGEAGPAESDCRVSWVLAHLDRDVDTLIAACETEECKFVALDWRPAELVEQLGRCEALGWMTENCQIHAFSRYFGGRPSLEQQVRDLPALERWGELAAIEAGNAAGCEIPVDCAAHGKHAATCEAARASAGVRACESFRPDYPRDPHAGRLTPGP